MRCQRLKDKGREGCTLLEKRIILPQHTFVASIFCSILPIVYWGYVGIMGKNMEPHRRQRVRPDPLLNMSSKTSGPRAIPAFKLLEKYPSIVAIAGRKERGRSYYLCHRIMLALHMFKNCQGRYYLVRMEPCRSHDEQVQVKPF